MMNCHKVQTLLSAYVDGEVTGTESLAVREHLDGCRACRSEYEGVQRIKAYLSGLQAPEPRPGFEAQLCSRVFAPCEPVRHVNYFRLALASTVGAMVITTVGFQLFQYFVSANRPVRTEVASSQSRTVGHDNAYFAAADPLTGQAPVMTTPYGDR